MSRCLLVLALTCGLASACGESASVECGPATRLEDGVCVASVGPVTDGGISCGPGTVEVEGECRPEGPSGGARYEVRVAATEISGNGYAKLPVFAIGTLADGTPSKEPVLLGVSRSGAGHFAEPVTTLTASGVTS